jgi:glycosyltransferase involved in cell wall biosynthesis
MEKTVKPIVLFIIPSFRRGGVERVTLNILNSLDLQKFDVTILICTGKNNEMLSQLHSEVQIIEVNKPDVRRALPTIFKLIKKKRPDIVFTSFNHLSLPILLYKQLTKLNYISIIRMNTLPSNRLTSNFRGRFYNKIFSKVIKTADYIIGQSDEMSKDIMSFYNLNKSKVVTIRNLVDIQGIKKQAVAEKVENIKEDQCYTLVSIGSLGKVKGYDLLIEAFYKLVKQGVTNLRLFIIGDNRESNEDYKKVLTDLIVEFKMSEYIRLLGFKSNPYPYLNQADAFVLSSRKEGFPNVVLEALALNKPCLVTDCVDFSGIVENGNNGLIVERGSVSSLMRGLLDIQEIKLREDFTYINFDYNEWFNKLLIK